MSHKLSIISRQHKDTGWHQVIQYDVPSIQEIKVDGSGKNRSLNAIPSPFARMHLFETAFQMVYQDMIRSTDLAGETYKKLVSDCFDVFELIYNWDAHVKDGQNLELSFWRTAEEINSLKSSTNKAHKLLGESLDSFLKGEQGLKDFEKCLLIKYNRQVIGGSSPFTGFITSPDDHKINLLKPLSQVAYFSRTISFGERKPEIKKFIYNFFNNNAKLRSTDNTNAIRDFLDLYKNEINGISENSINLKPLTNGTYDIELFGQPVLISKSIGTEFFEKYIVKLTYRINNNCFILPKSVNNERESDYLLPLSIAYFQKYDYKNVSENVTIREIDEGSVEVLINENGKTLKKIYQKKPLHETDGQIIDLKQINLAVNIGIFPFIRITNQPEDINFNDFYRVMLTLSSLDYNYSNNDFKLHFGKQSEIIENGEIFKVSRTDRRIAERDKSDVGSAYFGINTDFDFIQIEFPEIENKKIVNTIIPKWKEKSIGAKKFQFSVDLGTTSTFIALTDDATHQTTPQSLEFGANELPVALLHKPKDQKQGLRAIDCIESTVPELLTSIVVQSQEFVPSLIKRGENYNFPIRTSLYLMKSLEPVKKSLLENANISFVYQSKKDIVDLINQEYQTNLKWNIKTNRDFESSIEIYLQELFYLIRLKILLNDGDPRASKLCWFSPLSFTEASKRSYTTMWNKYSVSILKNTQQNIYNITESEAPCYYLFKNATINNAASVLTVDIGGGSTDIMLFCNNKAVLGTSVHFGANILWGNGFSGFLSEKTNGIYLSLRDRISDNLKHTLLKSANEKYCSEQSSFAGSDEIINFWIANKDDSKVLDLLDKGDYRLSYLLHLSALIYHTLHLLKSKNQPAPTCVIFSGNGSKYIDLIASDSTISKIWSFFIKHIFGGVDIKPQVVLPTVNRKEATCFGGLYAPTENTKYEVINYLGFEKEGEKYTQYRDIVKEQDLVFEKVTTSFKQFIDLFFDMSDSPELNFRSVFGIESKLTPIRKYLKEKSRENLNLGFLKRMESVDTDDLISDSLFYYPLVGLIYKINKLSADDINEMIDKSVLYFNSADNEGIFNKSGSSDKQQADSLYSITFENEFPDIGTVNMVATQQIQLRAITAFQPLLDPICEYSIFPEPGQNSIIQQNAGKAIKKNGTWSITEKVKITFA